MAGDWKPYDADHLPDPHRLFWAQTKHGGTILCAESPTTNKHRLSYRRLYPNHRGGYGKLKASQITAWQYVVLPTGYVQPLDLTLPTEPPLTA